jgi:predicted PurR-regulated permease PerM
MPEEVRPVALRLPWSSLLKIVALVGLLWIWRELAWLVMLILIAVIITVGLAPVVSWLEQRRWPRWLAASAVVVVLLAVMAAFFVVTWSSLSRDSADIGQRLMQVEQQIETRVPTPIVEAIRRDNSSSLIGPYAISVARGTVWFGTAFVLAWILVLYLLIEAEMTYRWVRGFVPTRLCARFDRTSIKAREAAFAYLVANVITSVCAFVWVFVWLTALHVPSALLLALLAFVFDFVPVLGFFVSCAPAVAMASTVSPSMALLMVPIYLTYHFVENYVIAPRVYGSRLRLSNVAVLIAFAIGAGIGGVPGALLALPLAAVYPAIERYWLRSAFGDEVVQEHERLRLRGA